MLVRMEHPTKGTMTQPGVGIVMDGTPMRVKGPAPLLGEHTLEVLTDIGYSREDADRLLREGIVATSTGPRRRPYSSTKGELRCLTWPKRWPSSRGRAKATR